MSHRFQFVPIAAVSALVALVAAGCGGQSHQGSSLAESAAPPQSYAALVAAADPICKKVAASSASANEALAKVSTSTAKTLQLLARVVPGIAAEEQDAIAALGALKQSGSQTHDWQTMLLYLRQLADGSKQLGAAAKAKDLEATHKITANGVQIQQKLGVIAARDGFAYCGRGN